MASPTPTSVLDDGSYLLTGCPALIDGLPPPYGYHPSIAAGIVFSVIFLLSFCGHLFKSRISSGRSFSLLLAVSALTELAGWAGRTWLAKCPYNIQAFMLQTITLIVAPVFVSAAIYVMLGQLIVLRGRQYSLVKPRTYLIIFCTSDVLALLVQAAGAASASHAIDDGGDTKPGSYTVAGGVVFQLLTMAIFALLFAVFLIWSRSEPSARPHTLLVAALWLSFICVLVRSVFRAIELFQGFTGYLEVHEGFFIGLDGVMMVIAIAVFNFVRTATRPDPKWATSDPTASEPLTRLDTYGARV